MDQKVLSDVNQTKIVARAPTGLAGLLADSGTLVAARPGQQMRIKSFHIDGHISATSGTQWFELHATDGGDTPIVMVPIVWVASATRASRRAEFRDLNIVIPEGYALTYASNAATATWGLEAGVVVVGCWEPVYPKGPDSRINRGLRLVNTSRTILLPSSPGRHLVVDELQFRGYSTGAGGLVHFEYGDGSTFGDVHKLHLDVANPSYPREEQMRLGGVELPLGNALYATMTAQVHTRSGVGAAGYYKNESNTIANTGVI